MYDCYKFPLAVLLVKLYSDEGTLLGAQGLPWSSRRRVGAAASEVELASRAKCPVVDRETLKWAVGNAFCSLERRSRVVARLIEENRAEFGAEVREPSIDALCVAMVSLATLAKYRFESQADKCPEQFHLLLSTHCKQTFTDAR